MRMKLSLFILLLVLAGIVLSFVPFRTSVSFYDAKTKELIAFMPIKKGQLFSIQYTHSIHLSLVEETYEVTNQLEIRQIELMYEDFAIGMPSDAVGSERFVQKDGKYYIKDMNRIFPEIVLRVGKVVANHQLVLGNMTVPMASFSEPGSALIIKPAKLNMWEQWKGVNVFDGF